MFLTEFQHLQLIIMRIIMTAAYVEAGLVGKCQSSQHARGSVTFIYPDPG